MKPIAVVQHEPSVPPGLIAEVFDRQRVPVSLVKAWEEPVWPEASEVSGSVVLGGTMNVDEIERYPFLRDSRAFMTATIEAGVPTLGVCLGSQMMSRVLGGTVLRAPSAVAGFGELTASDAASADLLLSPFVPDVAVLQFHEDTFTLPAGCTRLAVSSSGAEQAFRFEGHAWAIQFHFEIDRQIVEGWCENIGGEELASYWHTTEERLQEEMDLFLDRQWTAGEALLERFVGLIRDI